MRRIERRSIVITRIRWPKAESFELEQQVLSTIGRDAVEVDATVATVRALHVIRARHPELRFYYITDPDATSVGSVPLVFFHAYTLTVPALTA